MCRQAMQVNGLIVGEVEKLPVELIGFQRVIALAGLGLLPHGCPNIGDEQVSAGNRNFWIWLDSYRISRRRKNHR